MSLKPNSVFVGDDSYVVEGLQNFKSCSSLVEDEAEDILDNVLSDWMCISAELCKSIMGEDLANTDSI